MTQKHSAQVDAAPKSSVSRGHSFGQVNCCLLKAQMLLINAPSQPSEGLKRIFVPQGYKINSIIV